MRHRDKAKRRDCQSAEPMKPPLLLLNRHHNPPVVLPKARLFMATTASVRGFRFVGPSEGPLSTAQENFPMETSAISVSLIR
jgi:hypothetical protein